MSLTRPFILSRNIYFPSSYYVLLLDNLDNLFFHILKISSYNIHTKQSPTYPSKHNILLIYFLFLLFNYSYYYYLIITYAYHSYYTSFTLIINIIILALAIYHHPQHLLAIVTHLLNFIYALY